MKGSCHLDSSCTVHGSPLQHGRHGLERFPLRCTDNMEHQGLSSSPSTLTSDQSPRSVITSALHSGEGWGRRDVAAAAPSSTRPPGTAAPH